MGPGGSRRRIEPGVESEPGRIVVRRRGQEDGHAARAFDAECLPGRRNPPALRENLERGREAHVLASGTAQGVRLIDDAAGEKELIPGVRPGRRIPGPRQADGARYPVPAPGFDPDDQDIVRGRREDLPFDAYAFLRFAEDRRDTVADVQAALISAPRPYVFELDDEVAEGLVGADPRRRAEKVFFGERGGLGVFAVEERLANEGQVLERSGIVVVDGASRPHCPR